MRYVDAMDSDYDIDKLVEKLEENASRYTKKYNTHYGNNGYRDVKAISIHKAIEIVKENYRMEALERLEQLKAGEQNE